MGAVGVVLIMTLSPIASAGVTPGLVLKNATPQNFSDSFLTGCAKLSHNIARLDLHTGAGKFESYAKQATCSTSHHVRDSQASNYNELGVNIPVSLKSTNVGVSLGVSIKAITAEASAIKGSVSKCPVNYYNNSYYNGTTWENFSEVTADCYLEAGFYLSTYANLLDTTTGLYTYGTSAGPSSWSNSSGTYHDLFGYSESYSNKSDWKYNYSYPGTWSNATFGGNSTLTISATPTWYFNGTFVSTDKYSLEFYFDNEVYAEQYVYKGTSSASIDAATGIYHEDITSVALY